MPQSRGHDYAPPAMVGSVGANRFGDHGQGAGPLFGTPGPRIYAGQNPNMKTSRTISTMHQVLSMQRHQKANRAATQRTMAVPPEKCWEYWRKQLRSPTVFSLLTDFPRKTGPAKPPRGPNDPPPKWEPDRLSMANSRVVRAELSVAEVNAVKALFSDTHATLFEAFLGIFQVLMFRYARETDVIINTHTGVNVVALRVPLSGEMSFIKLLRMNKICVDQAFYYDLIDIAELAEDLGVPSFSHIAYQMEFPNEESDPEQKAFIASHEIGLNVSLHQEGMAVVSLHYDSTLFEEVTAQQILRHYLELARSLVLPDVRTAAIAVAPLMSPEEAKSLVQMFWPEQPDGPLVDHSSQVGHEEEYAWSTDDYLHAIFERQAAKSPDAPCIDDEGKVMTYKEVNERANRIARYLIEDVGVRIGELVATLLPRCGDVYVCQLAIMKAGCGYVCIDSTYPQDRVDYILQDSKARCLITVDALKGRQRLTPEFMLDDPACQETLRKKSPSPNPPVREMGLKSSDVCYVIYTSGTTGVPKGVVIEHRCVVNFVFAEGAVFKLKPSDRVLQGFSPSFDASVEEIWLAFNAGATLVVGTSETMQSGPNLPQLLYKMGITVVSTVPTLLTMISPSSTSTTQPRKDINDLPLVHLLILGGEACPAELINRWAPGRRLINSYGPTEATVVSTFEESVPGKRVTIGKPLPNYYCYVLDANMQPCPVGVPGELHVGGVALARGYLNLPDKTAEKFIPNPFASNKPGERFAPDRLYKTGDLVRFLRNGDIEFLGRIDSQVKLRGFRVELAEIESVICQLESVRSAVVAVKGQNLIAFVVPKDPNASEEDQKHGSVFVEDPNSLLLDPAHDVIAANFDMDATREYMRKMLPHYMMPGQIVLVRDIPSLPSGKADRKTLLQIQIAVQPRQDKKKKKTKAKTAEEKRAAALAAIAATAFEDDDPTKADEEEEEEEKLSVLEKEIQGVWEEVLGQSPIGPDDDFFLDLGGHSVVAALVVSALRKRDYTVSMRDLYEATTIRKFAAKLVEIAQEAETSEALPLAPPLPEYSGAHVTWLQEHGAFIFHSVVILCAFAWLAYLRTGLYYMARWVAEQSWYNTGWKCLLITGFAIPPVFTAILLTLFFILILCKMILFPFGIKAGVYRKWSWFHLRWWLVHKINYVFPHTYFRNTLIQRIYFRLLGVKIGKHCYIGTNFIYDWDLIEIQDGVSLGTQARIAAHRYEGENFILEPVVICRNAYVGTRSAISGGAVLEEGAYLDALSLLPPGVRIPAGQLARGSPAKVVGPAPPLEPVGESQDERNNLLGEDDRSDGYNLVNAPPPPASDGCCRNMTGFLVGLAQLFCAGFCGFFQLYPYIPAGVAVYLYYVRKWSVESVLLMAFVTTLISIFGFLIIILVLRKLIAGNFKAGTYPIKSWTYFRKWFFDMLAETALLGMQQLYATVYTPFFLYLMGVDLGKGVECSTLFDYTPGLTVLEDQCFIADHVALGSAIYRGGRMTLKETRVGRRTFVGNNAVLVTGSQLAPNSLIGVSSVPPIGEMPEGTSWVGSPSFVLPSRKVVDVNEDATFNPPWYIFMYRAWWEFWKVLVPPLLASANYGGFLVAIIWTINEYSGSTFLGVTALWGMASSAATCFVVFFLKWYFIGKFRQRNYPLWSVEVWRAEFVQTLEENIVAPAFLQIALGTWWAVAWFRLIGANIGERVILDTIYLCESDLITIDDDAVVESGATIQTHLFEDRVMKMEPLHIGRGCTVGANTVVLYSSRMEDGSCIDQCSLAMKGETLVKATRYEGIPAVAALDYQCGERPDMSITLHV